MDGHRLEIGTILRGALLAAAAGGLAVFLLAYQLGHWSTAKSMDAAVVWVAAVLGITALNGLSGVAPGVTAMAAIFGSSFGSFVGAALGEYRRVRGVEPEDVIDDLKDGLASITAAKEATAKPLFRDGTDDLVSRYKLNNTINNFILRYHDGQKYSRKAMVDDGVCDQRYWNLGRRVLQEIGLMDWDSPLFKTKGSLQLDLEWAGWRWRTSLGQQVWVLPAEEEMWREVDLHACHFLRDPGEKTAVPTLEQNEGTVEAG